MNEWAVDTRNTGHFVRAAEAAPHIVFVVVLALGTADNEDEEENEDDRNADISVPGSPRDKNINSWMTRPQFSHDAIRAAFTPLLEPVQGRA